MGGWAPVPVWTGAEMRATPEFDPRSVRILCIQFYTNCPGALCAARPRLGDQQLVPLLAPEDPTVMVHCAHYRARSTPFDVFFG